MRKRTYRFYDLIRAVPVDEILEATKKLYPKKEFPDVFDGFRNALNRLLTIEPNFETTYVLQAKVYKCDRKIFHEISCVLPTARKCKPLSLPWPEWLGAAVPWSVRKKYSPAELVAHCLGGLCRLGFSPEHIARTEATLLHSSA
jgi:hypothetical protein